MGCRTELVKLFVNIFIVLSLICGLTLTVFGGLMVKNITNLSLTKETWTLNSVAFITLILGIVISLISTLGFCGTLREKPCQLRTYAIIMLCLFICQTVLAIYVWTQYDKLRDHVERFVKTLWLQHHSDSILFHKMEKHLKCCGMNGFTDYTLVDEPIPSSCKSERDDDCQELNKINKIGCLEAISNLWESCAKYVKYASLMACGVMITVSTCSSYLAHKLRRQFEYEVDYD